MSPNYANDSSIWLAADSDANENDEVFRSTDGGTTWSSRSLVACSDSTIDSLLAIDQNTILIGCADGDVFRSINGGFLFSQSTGTPGVDVNSIAMSPNYATDNEILIGSEGDVRLSTDGGTTFTQLGISGGPGSSGADNDNAVAFHPDYASNSMVFAANVDSGDGVFRWIVGTSTSWLSLGLNPDGGDEEAQALAFGSDGALYVTDIENFSTTSGERTGGVWSSVTSTAGSATGVSFSQLQVTSNATNLVQASDIATGLAVATVSSNRIWVVETSSTDGLRHYTDTIANTVVPTGLTPADGSTGVGSSNSTANGITGFRISWDAVSGATTYQCQWGTSSTFASATTDTSSASSTRTFAEGSIEEVAGVTGDTQGSRLAGTTYTNWRVRVAAPVVGPCSPGQSFTTLLLAGATTGAPTLTQPNATNSVAALSSAVSLRPLFVWTAVGGATNYELQVSTDGTFIDASQIIINLIGADALGNTLAYQAAVDLQPGTVYFWRARGVSGTTVGAYPPAAAFTTSRGEVGGAVAAGTALANLEAVGTLELVSSFNYTTALFEAYVPGLAGNVLATIAPNTVIFITVTADTTVVVSGVAFDIRANTPTPVPVGASVTITIQ